MFEGQKIRSAILYTLLIQTKRKKLWFFKQKFYKIIFIAKSNYKHIFYIRNSLNIYKSLPCQMKTKHILKRLNFKIESKKFPLQRGE